MTASTPFRPVTIQMPPDLFERLAQVAEQEQRSISNMLRFIATRYLDDHQKATDATGGQGGVSPREESVPTAGTPGPTT